MLPRRRRACAPGPCHVLSLSDRHVLKVAGCLEESRRILDNDSAAALARAIAKAWELYGSQR